MKQVLVMLVALAALMGSFVAGTALTTVSADAPIAYDEYNRGSKVRDWNIMSGVQCLSGGGTRLLVPDGMPLSTCTVTTTTTPPTTTQPPTTTTAPPTTTTQPPAGLAFNETFSSTLNPAMFTVGHFRTEEASNPDPAVNGSKVLIENGTLRIESGEQNYGDSMARINQPFDWAGRTGTLTFDTDLYQPKGSGGLTGGWTRLLVSAEPESVPSYIGDNSSGQGPRNGFDLHFKGDWGCPDMHVWRSGVQETVDNPAPFGCDSFTTIQPGVMYHIAITVSATSVVVKMNGQQVSHFDMATPLPLSRGYVYLGTHNHATLKYEGNPTRIEHWDNVSFDGPVLPVLGVSTATTYFGGTVPGLPTNLTNPRLVLSAQHGQQDTNPHLFYSLNGSNQHELTLTRLAGESGTYALDQAIDPAELVAGTNTVAFTWTGTTGLAPTVANVQIVWDGEGATPPPPTTTTTTVPPTTTTVPPTTTTTPPTTTVPPSGTSFVENFSAGSLADFNSKFDHGWSGEWNAGALFGSARNDWHGDHDMACGDPNMTNRTIHLTSQQQANEAPFYVCVPGGDTTKAHLMTSVNTEGYVTVWFAPKQVFSNVNRVCWDVNLTDEGGGKWIAVQFLVPSEYQGQTDLGYTTPDFPQNGGPSSPQGPALNGVKVFKGGMDFYSNGSFRGGATSPTVTDKAGRYKHCVVDNNNGTVTTSINTPSGTTASQTVAGSIPDGDVRVVFIDDNYNPDKHFNDAGVPANSTDLYTWHWDNIEIVS